MGISESINKFVTIIERVQAQIAWTDMYVSAGEQYKGASCRDDENEIGWSVVHEVPHTQHDVAVPVQLCVS